MPGPSSQGCTGAYYLKWRRDSEYMEADPLEALKGSAADAGATLLDEVLDGYIVTVAAGGNEHGYLVERSNALLDEIEGIWGVEVQVLLSLAEVAFIVSVLAQLLSTLSGITSLDPMLVISTSLYLSLILDVIVVSLSDNVMPPISYDVDFGWAMHLAPASTLSILLISRLLHLQPHIAMPLATLRFLLPLSWRSISSALAARREESELSRSLREAIRRKAFTPGKLRSLLKGFRPATTS